MLERQPRTKLKFLNPRELQGKKEEKIHKRTKDYVDKKRGHLRVFEENEPVVVYDVRGSNGRNWKEGRIAKVISATTYLVLVNEKVRYVHAEYLKHSYNALLSKLNNSIQQDSFSLDTKIPDDNSCGPAESAQLTPTQTPPIRKSTRTVRPPNRLNL
ncbi:hypothetical protein QE152_g26071 [Popillia japonica]|uniref:Uncharacterized protein n=1 Tax=Popillia japonica TaxID=7064 RepID=A0AAW1K005_POPJA